MEQSDFFKQSLALSCFSQCLYPLARPLHLSLGGAYLDFVVTKGWVEVKELTGPLKQVSLGSYFRVLLQIYVSDKVLKITQPLYSISLMAFQ